MVGEDNIIYGMGASKDGSIGPNNNYETFTKIPFGEEDEITPEKIIQLSSGTHFTLFVTESGKLYACGNRFLKEIGKDCDNKVILLQLPQGIKCLNAYASMSKGQPLALIKIITSSGEEQMWSAGKND